ncbi:hypothetical protein SMICM17S_10156 [Streptomyces microflavus]
MQGDTQTAYVLALSMDLLSDQERATAADRLVALIEAKDWHLSTGFLGTPRLLPVLTETGHTDVAYRLLLQRTFPSWGYQIDRGATTMWERWDSIRPDGGFPGRRDELLQPLRVRLRGGVDVHPHRRDRACRAGLPQGDRTAPAGRRRRPGRAGPSRPGTARSPPSGRRSAAASGWR